MISAGRLLIMPKGAWNDTDTYSMLDLVSYNGSSYIAKTSVPANTLPTNTSYWQLSAYGGSAANLARSFAPLETTDYASQGYAVGDFLVNKDNQFCKVTSTITIGDELILKPNTNYNIEADNVGEEINAVYTETQTLTNQIDSIYEVIGQNGAVNIAENKGTTQTANNITFTVNADKTILVNASDSPSSNTNYYPNEDILLKAGKYRLTGCPSGGAGNTYRLQLYTLDGATAIAIDTGDGKDFELTSDTHVKMGIRIQSGYQVQNKLFKPMISDPSLNLSYDDYVPYAMTNRELTEINTTKDLTAQITNVSQKMTNPTYSLVRYGNVCSLRLFVGDASNVTAWTEALMTIPSDCKPKSDIYIANAMGSGKCILIRAASGDINVVSGSETLHSAQFFCTWVVL